MLRIDLHQHVDDAGNPSTVFRLRYNEHDIFQTRVSRAILALAKRELARERDRCALGLKARNHTGVMFYPATVGGLSIHTEGNEITLITHDSFTDYFVELAGCDKSVLDTTALKKAAP